MHITAGTGAFVQGSTERGATEPLVIAACSAIMLIALVGGVGIPNHMVLRHVIQTLPLWPALVLGLRRSNVAGWAGLPVFVFWLVLMTFIWLYLLGISHVLSGHFSPWEITMTAIVGVAAVAGVGAFARLRSSLSALSRIGMFILLGVVQFACFRISFLPAIAHR